MTAPKPPPRTLQPAEERKIQLFLERAAPIVLENPELTAERWQFLAALANDLDLTADQFRSTIDDLLNRGVIKRMMITPPKPPPLPGRRATETTGGVTNPPTEDFSLSPPGPPPIQHTPIKPPSVRDDQRDTVADGDFPAAVDSAAAPPITQIESESTPIDLFLERASAILAEQRGWTAKSHALISAAAKEFGLNEFDARVALNRLRSAEPPSAESLSVDVSKEKFNATRWRVEGAPAPVPPPSPKSPAETFQDFVRPSLASVREGVVSEELEQRVIAHGTRVLGLSPVYARHLLLDLVAERRMRLASTPESAPPVAAPAITDPRITEFLNAAAPILAQHRGLNAQSRVRLTALARERGLSEQEMEQAIGTMNAREPADTMSRTLQERLVPFRSHVEAHLKRVAGGILTPALNDKLVAAGVDLFGVELELAAGTIRETAATMQLAVVSHGQAEKHLANLLRDVIPAGTESTRAQRERIELEGAQWGLSAPRIAALIEDHLKQNELTARAEERVSRLALTSAITAVVLVLTFLAWAAISRSRRAALPPTPTTPTNPSATAAVPKPEKPKSWVNEHSDLSISIFNLRSDMPLLRKPLIDLGSNEAAPRNSAYATLVDHFLLQPTDELRRRDVAELLALCVAFDPVDDTAKKLITALLRDVPATDKAELNAAAIPRMYWGVRALSAALHHAVGRDQRVALIVTALHQAVGLAPDPSLPVTELEQLCLRGLSERLFRLVIAAADTPLPNVASLHEALSTEAARHLDAAKIHRFNADFLAATLTKDARRWPEFEDLLRRTSASRDALAVLELVELYEKTEDSGLRDFLGQVLVLGLPGTPSGKSVEEIAAFVRQGLGVRDVDDPEGIWTKLSRDARGVTTNATAPADPATPILAETLQLAHYSTLACAFAQNEWSNAAIVEWRKNGPKSPEPPAEAVTPDPTAAPSDSPTPTKLDRATLEVLRSNMVILTARRSQPTARLEALDSLARLVESVPDLPPDMAGALASYVLGTKSGTEHARVLDQISTLDRWNQLLVAMVDRVDESLLTHEQLQSLLNAMTGTEISLSEGKEGRTAARREILRFTMQRLGSKDDRIKPPSDPAENTAALLADAYAVQARLIGVVVPDEATQSRDPQATLRLLVDEFQSRLAAAKLSEGQRTELARIPHELAASEFLGTNEIQKLVLLERVWLKLLALEAARRQESRAAEANKLVQNLQQQDRKATHVLTQLRDGHAMLLQMWLLIGKRG